MPGPGGPSAGSMRPQEINSISQTVVEQRVDHLLACIQPNAPSELRRLTIASYVCDLIRRCFASQRQVEAFMFGSVPLRTYLPDGDIDISLFFPLHGPADPLKETWNTQLLKALEREAGRRDAPFRIRNCQIIQAEFRLVKFVVADVVVDVSFNALGGLCTVAFLEWVDRTVGRNHLFKRSIVLVKAWCYYESRLLGAHHGLISSYALEAMVLYVFNLHGADLHSPLQVLLRFLKEFSTFEWEKYALTMLGPLPLAELPRLRVAREAMPPGSTLIDTRELRDAVQRYSVQPAASVAAMDALLSGGDSDFSVALPRKLLNIMDPLLPTNNLGRSVSKASFNRIRRALAFGAERLEAILAMEPLAASEGIAAYFQNTWRSPTRMAADNQVFQSRLALSTSAQLLQQQQAGQQRPGSAGSGRKGRTSGAANGSGAGQQQQAERSLMRRHSSASLSEAVSERSTSSAGDREDAGAASSQGRTATPTVPPLPAGASPPGVSPAAAEPIGSASSSHTKKHAASPMISPRSATSSRSGSMGAGGSVGSMGAGGSVGSATGVPPVVPPPGTVFLGPQQWTLAGQPTFIAMMPPIAAGAGAGGGRGAYHASLTSSPVVAPLVAFPATSIRQMPFPAAASSANTAAAAAAAAATVTLGTPAAAPKDIFMSDLDGVLSNLTTAREFQPQPVQQPSGASSGSGQSSAGATDGGASTPLPGASNDRELSADALEAAMAALPPVRVTAAAPGTYASVIAQGLTPLTVPNSLEVSAAPSAAASAGGSRASSAANTPRSTGAMVRPGSGVFNAAASRPPMPGKKPAGGSGTTTPTATAAPIPPLPPMPKAAWGRGQWTPPPPPAASTAAPSSPGAAAPMAAAPAPIPAAPIPAPGSTATAAAAAAGAGTKGIGRGSWSALAAAPPAPRLPSRLGQMHGSSGNLAGSSPRTSAPPSAAGSVAGDTAPPSAPSSPPAPAAPSFDPESWPSVGSAAAVAIPAADRPPRSSLDRPVVSPAAAVWGSVPASVRSGASTPVAASPRVGNWAAALTSPAKAPRPMPPSPGASPHAPTSARAAQAQAQAPQNAFTMRRDEFPSLR